MKINNGNKNNTGNRRKTLKKIILILMLGLSATSFSIFDKIKSEIKWKEEEQPRFGEVKVIIKGEPKMRKVIPGKYEIRIYELNYPESLSEKNKFYNEFNQVLKNVDKNKKYSLLLEKRFYDDMKKIEESQLSDEENLLEIPASSLDENQRQDLISMSSKLNLTQYLGTDQEFLNRQVYILNQLLNKDGFDENNVYSELDKEFLVSELKEKRKNIVENFRKSNFEYFVKESYKNIDFNKFEDDSIYTFDKDIVISENIEDQAILPEIKENIYLTDFPKDILNKLATNKLKLKRQILLIENNEYQGYTYNEENTVIFINGKKPKYYYGDYKINVIKRKTDVLNLLRLSSNYYVSDFFK